MLNENMENFKEILGNLFKLASQIISNYEGILRSTHRFKLSLFVPVKPVQVPIQQQILEGKKWIFRFKSEKSSC